MGTEERRERERAERRAAIVRASWWVAEHRGWSGFSMERVAATAELGRATLYSYFDSLAVLIAHLAQSAADQWEELFTGTTTRIELLDLPVRFYNDSPAAFELLFPRTLDPRPQMNTKELSGSRQRARRCLLELHTLVGDPIALAADPDELAVLVAALSLSCTCLPELRDNPDLRRRFHQWVLDGELGQRNITPTSAATQTPLVLSKASAFHHI